MRRTRLELLLHFDLVLKKHQIEVTYFTNQITIFGEKTPILQSLNMDSVSHLYTNMN